MLDWSLVCSSRRTVHLQLTALFHFFLGCSILRLNLLSKMLYVSLADPVFHSLGLTQSNAAFMSN